MLSRRLARSCSQYSITTKMLCGGVWLVVVGVVWLLAVVGGVVVGSCWWCVVVGSCW